MILKVINHINGYTTKYYTIPNQVGDYIIEKAGPDVFDPCTIFSEDFSDLLYLIAEDYIEVEDKLVDIVFHLC